MTLPGPLAEARKAFEETLRRDLAEVKKRASEDAEVWRDFFGVNREYPEIIRPAKKQFSAVPVLKRAVMVLMRSGEFSYREVAGLFAGMNEKQAERLYRQTIMEYL